MIRGYISTNDWTSVETLLNEDLTPANRRRLVGAKMQQQQFTSAASLLEAFPQTTLNDQYFVQTQNINLARLQTDGFTMTQEQEFTLLGIAQSATSEAGYAQTLLNLLTGQVFMPRLPDIGEERSAKPASLVNSNEMSVSPNPVSDVLTVQLPDHLTNGMLHLVEVARVKRSGPFPAVAQVRSLCLSTIYRQVSTSLRCTVKVTRYNTPKLLFNTKL